MSPKPLSFVAAILFNLISISLISSVLLFRADVIRAQSGSPKVDDVALVPRSVEVTETDDEDDSDGGDDDPPTDNDGYDTPPGEVDEVITYTIRPGDTLWKLAARLGVPYAVLRAQDDSPSVIHPGQKFVYRLSDRVDSSIPPTDDDGTDSDGYDTPPPTTDFDGISTPPPTDNDGTDSDGFDTTGAYTDNDGTDSDGIDTETGESYNVQARQQQANQPQNAPYTDNDGTDSDGYDTTGNLTDNDGTDSDGIATSQLTDNDGTDSDGIDTTGQQNDTDNNDSDVSDDSSVSS